MALEDHLLKSAHIQRNKIKRVMLTNSAVLNTKILIYLKTVGYPKMFAFCAQFANSFANLLAQQSQHQKC